jgi:hypothetical protein
MASSHAHAHHFHVPHLHLHAPHVDWHDIDDWVVGTLAAAVLLMTIGAATELPTPSFVSAATPAAVTAATPTFTTPPLPREWRTRHYPSFDHMYANPSETRLDWIRTPGAR